MANKQLQSLSELRNDEKIHQYKTLLTGKYNIFKTYTDDEYYNEQSDITDSILWSVRETITNVKTIKFEGWENELSKLELWFKQLSAISEQEDEDDYFDKCMNDD